MYKKIKTNSKEKIKRDTINKIIFQTAKQEPQELFEEFNVSFQGLDPFQVEENREKYGKNETTQKKKEPFFKRFLNAYINPFTIVLLALAVISVFTDVIFASANEREFNTIIIIVSMVIISGTLRFIQETKSGNAAEKLKQMVMTTTAIMRNGVKTEMELKEAVVGDIVLLAAGDMVPADVRILQAKDLFIGQSSLTGESEPLEKTSQICVATNPLELNNFAFLGSNVISGSAICLVVAVGDDTIFGSMAQQLTKKRMPTSFDKGINSVSWILIKFMMCMAPIVFFINGITKGVIWGGGYNAWEEALLFSLAIAVGLTPEMLPMIVTTGLAKGALMMSKKKVIVKNLNAIQNLGSIDILCADKTGTLTQDKVVLEYHLDVMGNETDRVLRHAFLNSFYQTGLKNLMDVAIIDASNKKQDVINWKQYKKIDEIPFDFNRKRMSVVVKNDDGKVQMITKGAVEEMLAISSFVEYNGEVKPITAKLKAEISKRVASYNKNGLRVIAVAQKTNPSAIGAFSVKDETNMVLIGYLAFLDPPKQSALTAIKALKEHGVNVKVLTGDNDAVAHYICEKVGIDNSNIILGSSLDDFSDDELKVIVESTSVFAKLNPMQKAKIIKVLRSNGHSVGFMGDGINDAVAMRTADVGISVDTAVDIAKESADIILLEKDLMILEQGIREGRKTFANIIKYIKMTASSNFGNMLSILVASAFLPFLPMLPLQILVLNLIYDFSCIAIPWDNVDEDFLKTPRKWNASSIAKFMFWIGPTSSFFDLTTFLLMFFIICPKTFGGGYYSLSSQKQLEFMALFQTGWFVESLWSQTLVIHMIRTPKIPFLQSRASALVTTFTGIGIIIGTILPFTPLSAYVGMTKLPLIFFAWLILTIFLYMCLATLLKKLYVKKYKELL